MIEEWQYFKNVKGNYVQERKYIFLEFLSEKNKKLAEISKKYNRGNDETKKQRGWNSFLALCDETKEQRGWNSFLALCESSK